MSVERTPVYCQNCRTQNSLKDSHCQNCGTRLLLVVFPPSLQFDSNHTPSFYEDHLLERVSTLELRFAQLTEGLRAAADVISEQGRLIQELNRELRSVAGEAVAETPMSGGVVLENTGGLIAAIVLDHDSPNVELFSKLLTDSIALFSDGEEKEAFRMLERAVLLSPRNRSLLFYAASAYFFADRFSDSRRHLERCFAIAPDDLDILLLLGAISADDGDFDKSRRCLSILAGAEKTSGVVNLIWALVSAADSGNWAESLAAVKIAASLIDVAEIHYLAGCLNFELGDDSAALRSLQKAISLDRRFSDAWFMQAAVYKRQGDQSRCANMLDNATQTKGAGSQCVDYLRKDAEFPPHALPFLHFGNRRSLILTGGSPRIARLIKSELTRIIARSSN